MTDIKIQHNPFPGLRPFEQEQHHLFFGREEQVEELQRRLKRNRFLTVVGPSGSGKSSLIRAGLIPGLYEGEQGEAQANWEIVVFRPGEDPLGNMCVALAEAGLQGIVDGIVQGRGLAELAVEAGIGQGTNLLILVDQFEEIFRFRQQSKIAFEMAFTFVQLLLDSAAQVEVPIYTVLTMRADFLGMCTAFQGLPEVINNGQYLIPRMTKAQLRSAIEKPVAVGQGQIALGLVERLLEDMGDNPDQLPIMQHALMRTWDYWENLQPEGPIDLQHYAAIGSIKEALSQHAEEVYSALPDPQSVRTAELLFKCLTDKVENTRGVRRPTPLHEICAVTEVSRDKVIAVVEHFRQPGRWFLTPPPEEELNDQTILDIAHESLMRVWQRLTLWVGEEAESSQQYVRLANTAALYQEGKAGLYQDPDLELALNWRQRTKPTGAWAQRYDPTFERAVTFLEHSRKERDFIIATREEQQRRQLRRARRVALLAGFASIVFLFLMVFTLDLFFDAERDRLEADTQRDIAEQQQQIAERERLEADTQRQDALAQRQIAEERKEEAEQEKEIADSERQKAHVQRQFAEQQQQIAEERKEEADSERQKAHVQRQFAEQQQQIAEERKEEADSERRRAERLLLLSIARSLSGEAVKIHLRNIQSEVGSLLGLQAYRFHIDNGGSPLDPDIYNGLRLSAAALGTGRSQLLRGHEDEVRAALYTQEPQLLVSASDDGTVRLWDQQAGATSQRILYRGRHGVRALAYRPESGFLAAGTAAGQILRWSLKDLDTAPVVYTDKNTENAFVISSLAMDRQGRWLVAAALDGVLRVWHMDDASDTPQVVFSGPKRLDALAIGGQNAVLAWGGEEGKVHLKKLNDPGAEMPFLPASKGPLKSLAFGPQGKILAAGYANGDVLLWDWLHQGAEPAILAGHTSTITGIKFTPLAERVATSSLDQTVRIWSVTQPEDEPIILEHDHWLWNVGFSPDATEVVAAGADKNLYLWTVQTDILSGDICGRVSRNLTVKEWQRYVGAEIPYEKTCPERTASLKNAD